MRRSAFLLTLLVIITAMPAAVQSDPSALLRAWSEAYATVDGQRVAALYVEDARLWGTTDREQTVGRAALATRFGRARPGTAAISVVFGEHRLRMLGETIAVASGHYTFRQRRADGTDIQNPSRFSMVMMRSQDGIWRIVDHHSSRLPAAPQ